MKMEPAPFVRSEPALYLCAFMRAVVVHYQVDFLVAGKLAFQMIQEPYELAAAVPFLTGADHFPIENVERGEQSSRAVTFVVVSLPFRQARSQGKNRRGAIQCLDLALLIDAQYQRPVGWVHVEAYNVAHLFLKLRIVGQFEALDTMGLHIMALPDAVNDCPGYPQVRCKHAHAPMRAAITRTSPQRRVEDALLQFWRQYLGRAFSPANAGYGLQTLTGKCRSQRQHGRT